MTEESCKLWGGRFDSGTDPLLEALNSSISVDKRMYAEDIFGSQKYAEVLGDANLLTSDEVEKMVNGLDAVRLRWDNGQVQIQKGDEDIHTINERLLGEEIGDLAGKLHVGRSRNDQVVTDLKLWLKDSIQTLNIMLRDLIRVMANRAESDVDILMPGYTHLQRAQPVRWSHWLLSHAWSFKADVDRLMAFIPRMDILPLGSGAIAGNPFNIDRQRLADILGFRRVTKNSMHAVSDRDFVAEFLFCCSLTGIHLSRLAEDLVLFSTKEFGFVQIDDTFSTGSSLMPQKRNPDSLELIRGSSGTIFGQLSGFLMTLKGIPSTYNKDLQSDKEAMFGAQDKLSGMLRVAIGTIATLKVNRAACEAALSCDMLATDVAYYLVRRGVPFRKAHALAGQVVRLAEGKGVAMTELTLADFLSISTDFNADITEIWNYESSVEQYKATGGTSRLNVLMQIKNLLHFIEG